MNQKKNVNSLLKAAIVCGLYVAVTLLIAPISSGPIQMRLSELFNFLAFYNKRYVASVTIGCAIANVLTYGPVDMVVGSLSTLVFVSLGLVLFQNIRGNIFGASWLSMPKRFVYFSLFFAASMVTIAAELYFLFQAPFWLTWLTTATGELLSLLIGGWLIARVSKHIDFTL